MRNKTISFILTAVMLFSVLCCTPVTASAEESSNAATTYIKDLIIVGDPDDNQCKQIKNELEPQGWNFIWYDLNKDSGGDYIYLAYQTTTDPSEAVQDISFTKKTDKQSGGFDTKYGHYSLVPTSGKVFNGDLNAGAGGNCIYMYYTKSSSFLMPIKSIWINNDKPSDKEKSMNYVGSEYYDGKHTAGYGMDLNDGAGGKYIYLHFDREYDGTNWMAGIDDDVFLSDLSIPGVHDAACYQIGQFNDTYAQTQWHYIGSGDDYVGYWNGSDDQTTRGLLDRGVRYFDLRIKTPATYDTLILGHTVEDAKLRRDGLLFLDKTYDLTFIKVWNWIVTFLQEHPTETIIIYPADEDFTSNAAAKTAKRVYQFLKGKAEAPDSIIWSGDHVPTLGEVRGKSLFTPIWAAQTGKTTGSKAQTNTGRCATASIKRPKPTEKK